jgi:molybdopterin/thiamine biosynthesis adenylyltransferase
VAVIQAAEVIKLLAGFGRPLTGRMLYINEATMDFGYRDLSNNPRCQVCGVKERWGG